MSENETEISLSFNSVEEFLKFIAIFKDEGNERIQHLIKMLDKSTDNLDKTVKENNNA